MIPVIAAASLPWIVGFGRASWRRFFGGRSLSEDARVAGATSSSIRSGVDFAVMDKASFDALAKTGVSALSPMAIEASSVRTAAASFISAVPDMTDAMLRLILGMTNLESSFGKGWGSGCWNMGAEQASNCNSTEYSCIPHVDHHMDGSEYTANYKCFPSQKAAALGYLRLLAAPRYAAAWNAAERGDAVGFVNGLFHGGWFEGVGKSPEIRCGKYLAGILRRLPAIDAALGSAGQESRIAGAVASGLLGFSIGAGGGWMVRGLLDDKIHQRDGELVIKKTDLYKTIDESIAAGQHAERSESRVAGFISALDSVSSGFTSSLDVASDGLRDAVELIRLTDAEDRMIHDAGVVVFLPRHNRHAVPPQDTDEENGRIAVSNIIGDRRTQSLIGRGWMFFASHPHDSVDKTARVAGVGTALIFAAIAGGVLYGAREVIGKEYAVWRVTRHLPEPKKSDPIAKPSTSPSAGQQNDPASSSSSVHHVSRPTGSSTASAKPSHSSKNQQSGGSSHGSQGVPSGFKPPPGASDKVGLETLGGDKSVDLRIAESDPIGETPSAGHSDGEWTRQSDGSYTRVTVEDEPRVAGAGLSVAGSSSESGTMTPKAGSSMRGIMLSAIRSGTALNTSAFVEVEVPSQDLVITVPRRAFRAVVPGWGDGRPLLVGWSYRDQIEACRILGMISMTQEMIDAVWRSSFVTRIEPVGQWQVGADISAMEFAVKHTASVDKAVAALNGGDGPKPDATIRPEGKGWVIDPMLPKSSGAVLWGWQKTSGVPMQPFGYRHNADHVDYSMCEPPAQRQARILSTGKTIDLLDWYRTKFPQADMRPFLDAYDGAAT